MLTGMYRKDYTTYIKRTWVSIKKQNIFLAYVQRNWRQYRNNFLNYQKVANDYNYSVINISKKKKKQKKIFQDLWKENE